MEKVIKKYFGVVLFYLTIIGGILLLNERFSLINSQNVNNEISIMQK